METLTTWRACLKGKGTILKNYNILSFGVNSFGDDTSPGIHAEHEALMKLQPLKIKKNLAPIDILVVRLSRTNKLQNSKPCQNCIERMETMPNKKGYKIRNIYYSGENGDIIKTTLNKLKCEAPHYSKYYRQFLDNQSGLAIHRY